MKRRLRRPKRQDLVAGGASCVHASRSASVGVRAEVVARGDHGDVERRTVVHAAGHIEAVVQLPEQRVAPGRRHEGGAAVFRGCSGLVADQRYHPL